MDLVRICGPAMDELCGNVGGECVWYGQSLDGGGLRKALQIPSGITFSATPSRRSEAYHDS